MRQKSKTMFTYLTVFSLSVLLFTFSEAASRAAKAALGLCAGSLIPSLFPFLVLCELITKSGFGVKIGRLLSLPAKKLFSLTEGGACALFCGAVCGFPIGVMSAVSLYKRGDISKKELSHLLLFCNNTGPGFLVFGVGSALFGSVHFGLVLYVCQLLSAFIIGVSTKGHFSVNNEKESACVRTLPITGAELFGEAITKAGASMVNVCAYIVFFSILSGVLSEFLPEIIVCGLLEISSGALAAAKLLDYGISAPVCAAICALFVGWAGLSVHTQAAAICKGEDISLFPYVAAKFVHGIICAALVFLYFILSPKETLPVFASEEKASYMPMILSFTVNIAFIFAVLKNLIKKGSKKRFFVIS